jgi:hypothetical protein
MSLSINSGSSSLAFVSWDGAFAGDAVLTAAMLDRIPPRLGQPTAET